MIAEPVSLRLRRAAQQTGSLLCLGLDPVGADSAASAERQCRDLIDACLEHCVAAKPNLAFFEQFGSPGVAVLERIRTHLGDRCMVILDGKRGDIGNTAAAYGRALFDVWGADAITVNPLMGRDSVEPLMQRPGTLVFLLSRTSNPGAADFLEQPMHDGRPLRTHIVNTAATWSGAAEIGFVVGATNPAAIADTRAQAPEATLLLPGVGAQGGDLEAAVRAGIDAAGAGTLISVSRGISCAENPGAAAKQLRERIVAAISATQV